MGLDKSVLLLSNIEKCLDKPKDKPLLPVGDKLQQALDDKLEKEIHGLCVRWLNSCGIIVGESRMDKKSTYTPSWPDLTFCWKGHMVCPEIKVPGKDATEDQRKVLDRLIENGAYAFVCHSLDELISVCKRLI